MERLWAGDYSQLPAGQQLHALNLSAQQQQQAWLGQHQVNKVICQILIAFDAGNLITFQFVGTRHGRDKQRRR